MKFICADSNLCQDFWQHQGVKIRYSCTSEFLTNDNEAVMTDCSIIKRKVCMVPISKFKDEINDILGVW